MPTISATGWTLGCGGTSTKMSVVPDILESWRAPGRVVRRHLARPRSEAFLFTFLFTFLLIAFIAQWPIAARLALQNPDAPLAPRMFAAGLGLLATIPVWYGLAALSRLLARAMGGQGDWYSARLALFWALATITPAMLLMGLSIGILGQGTQTNALGLVVGVAFFAFWFLMLRATERPL